MKPIISLMVALLLSAQAIAQAPMTSVEYWFDTDIDPILSIPTNSATIDLSNAIFNTDGLAVGPHTVHLRLREDLPGANGARFSSVVSRPFQKYHTAPWQITAVRYWMSEEPVPQDMHYLWFDEPLDSINYNSWLEMCDFAPQTGYLKLQLRDNHGQWSVVEERPVTINNPGLLELQNITANSTTFCPGESYTFTANSFSGTGYATPTSFTWTIPQGNGWSAMSSTGSSIQVIIGTAPGVLSVVSHNACGSSLSVSLPITLPTLPNITVSDAQPAQACANTNNLTYAVTPDNSTWTYAWSGPAGWNFTGNDATMVASTGANPAAGNISITANNACGQVGNTVTIPVTITPEPGTPGAISGPGTLCEGSSGSYQVGSVANADTYLWSTGATTNPVTVVVGGADFNISVQGVNACGIAGSASPLFEVEVTPLPGVIAITGPTQNCVGDEASYMAEPIIEGATYGWTWPSGFTDMVQSGNGLAGNIGPDALSGVIAVDVSVPACGSIAATLDVAVSDVPEMQSNSLQGPLAVCEGTSGSFSLDVVPEAEGYVWSWPGGTTTSLQPNVDLSFGTLGGPVTVVAQNGCGFGAPANLNVAVVSAPEIPVITGDTQLCQSDQNLLQVATVIPGETYVWSGLVVDTASSVVVSSEGELTVSAYTTSTCSSAHDTVQVTVDDLSLTSIDGPIDIYDFGQQTYTAVPVLDDATSYVWNWTGQDIAQIVGGTTGASVTLDFFANGVDTLSVIATSDSCVSDTVVVLVISESTGMGATEPEAATWAVMPNPSTGLFVIQAEGANGQPFSISNLLGVVLHRGALKGPRTTLDLTGLASGPYTLRRMDRPGEVVTVIIQH